MHTRKTQQSFSCANKVSDLHSFFINDTYFLFQNGRNLNLGQDTRTGPDTPQAQAHDHSAFVACVVSDRTTPWTTPFRK